MPATLPPEIERLINSRSRLMTPANAPAVRLQQRADAADDEAMPDVAGYGAVFYKDGDPGTEYVIWPDFYERFLPGCCDRALKEDDVRSLFNHDPNIVLGRNKASTLELSADEVGLFYSATPPDTQLVRDQVVAPIRRGDVTGSSVMFNIRRKSWTEEERDGRPVIILSIEEIELWETGPVTFPAYESTTTGLRMAGGLQFESAIAAELREKLANRGRDRLERLRRQVVLPQAWHLQQ